MIQRPADQTPGQLTAGLNIRDFEGPLALLSHLIDRNRFNLYDIPIADITGQYLELMRQTDALNMDLASDFLVMAATLIHIKSRMLLPDSRLNRDAEETDPREELILQLLEYRRCKWIAGELSVRQARYRGSLLRLPASPKDLGIRVRAAAVPEAAERSRFDRGAEAVVRRNGERYQDLSARMKHLLRRESVSLPEKIRYIWRAVRKRGRIFFTELFGKGSSRAETVTGFLALLELVRRQYVRADQSRPFAPIELDLQAGAKDTLDLPLPPELLKESVQDYN